MISWDLQFSLSLGVPTYAANTYIRPGDRFHAFGVMRMDQWKCSGFWQGKYDRCVFLVQRPGPALEPLY